MPAPASRIYDVCAELLAAVVAEHGGTLPARQYVSAGAPAWDSCEVLAVWCERTAGQEGNIGQDTLQPHQRGAGWAMRTGVFVVTLTRCSAVVKDDGSPPTVTEEETAAAVLYEDAQRILNALIAAEKDGLASCQGLAFVDWRPLGPDGGFVAGELRVRVGLSGGF